MKLKPVPLTKKQLVGFQAFQDGLQESIEHFRELASSIGLSLELNVLSLSAVEELCEALLGRGEPVEVVAERGAGFLGELFRSDIGGDWELCVKDKKYLYFGLPVVSGYATCEIEFCPLVVLRNFCYSQRRGMLERAVGSHREFRA